MKLRDFGSNRLIGNRAAKSESILSTNTNFFGPDDTAEVILFSEDLQKVDLHFLNDRIVLAPDSSLDWGHLHCLGEECVFCTHCEKQHRPKPFGLLPALSLDHDEVRIMMLPDKKGDYELTTVIANAIEQGAIEKRQIVKIKREKILYKETKYHLLGVRDRPGKYGENKILEFLGYSNLVFGDIFNRYSKEELVEGVQVIKNRLKVSEAPFQNLAKGGAPQQRPSDHKTTGGRSIDKVAVMGDDDDSL